MALRANETAEIRVVATGAALGADIEGVDLARPMDHATVALIRAAWMEHLVLRFRGQRLTDEQLCAASARFGELDRAPIDTNKPDAVRSYVSIISNVIENGRPIGGLGNGESKWHTDMSYNDLPPTASMLYALEVPPSGGDTGFCNMYLAYEALSEPMRRRIAGLTCKHDAAHNSVGEKRYGMADCDDPRTTPGAVHPLVRTHPETGRKALFLGRRNFAYITGLSLDDSEALLDELWAHAAEDRFTWYQQWRRGDAVMWDNRCVMHRRDAFDPTARRVMHRTQLVGDRPY
jgi:taurine dioxygenase